MENEMSSVEKMKPTIHIGADYLPEIKNAKIGQLFTLTVKAKVKGLNEGCCGDDKLSATLEIQSINDKAFKDKSYSEIIEEDSEIEEKE